MQKTIFELTDLQMLTYAWHCKNDIIANQYKGYFNEEYCYYLDNQNNILQLVAENKAVTIYPPKILGEHILVKSGLITSRPIQGIATHVTYLLFYPAWDALSAAEKEVIKLVKQEFQSLNI